MQMVFLRVGAGKDPMLMMINFHIVVVGGTICCCLVKGFRAGVKRLGRVATER